MKEGKVVVKKIISFLLVVVLSFGMAGTVSANNISTYDLSGHTKYSSLSISDKKATCTSVYQSLSDDCSYITAVQTLEKHSWFVFWDTVGDECKTTVTNKGNLSFTNYKDNLDYGTYRVKTVFTVVLKNGQSDTVTVYSSEKKVV